MGKSTKFYLLFSSLIALFLMSFTTGNRSEICCTPLDTATARYFSFVTNNPEIDITDGISTSSLELYHTHKTLHIKDKQEKYRKKYKRTSPVFPSIKPPVKEVTPVVFNTTTPTYSKPYFLSHLQHFLFRLTPF